MFLSGVPTYMIIDYMTLTSTPWAECKPTCDDPDWICPYQCSRINQHTLQGTIQSHYFLDVGQNSWVKCQPTCDGLAWICFRLNPHKA